MSPSNRAMWIKAARQKRKARRQGEGVGRSLYRGESRKLYGGESIRSVAKAPTSGGPWLTNVLHDIADPSRPDLDKLKESWRGKVDLSPEALAKSKLRAERHERVNPDLLDPAYSDARRKARKLIVERARERKPLATGEIRDLPPIAESRYRHKFQDLSQRAWKKYRSHPLRKIVSYLKNVTPATRVGLAGTASVPLLIALAKLLPKRPVEKTAADEGVSTSFLPEALILGGVGLGPATGEAGVRRLVARLTVPTKPWTDEQAKQLAKLMGVADVPISPYGLAASYRPPVPRTETAIDRLTRWIMTKLHPADLSSYARDEVGSIVAPRSYGLDTLAHEMGHAGRRKHFRWMHGLGDMVTAKAGPYPALAAGLTLASNPDDSAGSSALKGGALGLLAAAPSYPALAEEVRASNRAIRALRKMKQPFWPNLGRLAGALSTHAYGRMMVPVTAGIMAAMGGRMLRKGYRAVSGEPVKKSDESALGE